MSEAAVKDADLQVRSQGSRMELQMRSNPAVLRPVRVALEEFGRRAGLECTEADEIGLALNEALANVMRHGYGGATDKPIVVTFDRREQGKSAVVEVTIRDWAKPFDPAKLPKDPPPPHPDKIKPGGLGLLCMRRTMDEVVYTPQSDGMLLTMVKKVGKL